MQSTEVKEGDRERNSPSFWSRLRGSMGTTSSTQASAGSPTMAMRWRPADPDEGPELVVTQGDLTAAHVDAIVNAANSHLTHGGGLAAAIVKKGGRDVVDDCQAWLQQHDRLPVGQAMVTRAGRLPCRHVIHVVGPSVGGGGYKNPTLEQAQLLRDGVRNALCEAEKLKIASVAFPGISSGHFGYPTELAATEIVSECAQYLREKAGATTLQCIAFVNIDVPTCRCFADALRVVAEGSGRGDLPEQTMGSAVFGYVGGAHSTANESAMAEKECTQRMAMLPVRVGENDFEVLLGVEYTASEGRGHGCYLNLLSWRVKDKMVDEDSRDAAARLLSKRTGGVVPMDTIRQAVKEASHLWLQRTSTTLYFVRLDDQAQRDLPHKYERWRMKTWGSVDAPDHIVWVPWRSIKAAIAEASKTRASYRYGQGKVRTPFGPFRLSSLVSDLVDKSGVDVEGQLESLLLERAINSEVCQIVSLKSSPDSELIAKILGRDWKLRLTHPPMPPPTPLELLSPDSAEYKRVLAGLPGDLASRVVSIRWVRALPRRGDYEKAKHDVRGAQVNEEEPLYHGTPERWRATAIALDGFDLTIKLHGRSVGDGVYTTTQVSTAIAFTKAKGSLLRLRGLVVSECKPASYNTIVRGDVRVFQNPKALLPLAIADYAAEDELDQVETQQREVQEQYARMMAQRRAIQATMAVAEAEFEASTSRRLRAALDVYCRGLRTARASFGANKRSPSRQFFQEHRHFQSCLPMYEVKPALVKVLQAKPIVILVADTGSGKSTQLPQMLFDEVVPAFETRRIAILEPRRVNAISLSKRVSEERGQVPGQEVGYTIGRGDSNATPGVTRLEYMTHGLFVQMARDPVYLQKNYCAIIVDEAHERSVDVDLSLALLQRVLKQQPSGTSAFHVIVTSATIEDEAEKFQRYLDPSQERSTIFRVHGRAFPVHIEHRDDVKVDRNALGTASAGRIMTSAAIQSAMELLRTTEEGNILVFLPGEGSINDAIAAARNEIVTSATVESLDTFSSLSPAFCFRMSTLCDASTDDEEKVESSSDAKAEWIPRNAYQRFLTTFVVGFHGKTTRAERDRVLYPHASSSRLLVFTTNMAETGVTIPNVRYVIDTGLERRVRWNAALDMNEMVTEPISKSSMIQRAGRAGRTASGICVRLYPEDSVGDFIRQSVAPAVQNAMIYKAVLLNKEMESRGEEQLEMLDPFDPSSLAQAEQRLVSLGAVDADDGGLTAEGKALLRIGIDLRLGRFLIACARLGCLATGVKLASVLIAADAPDRLLPNRSTPSRTERMKSLIDPSGDHLTLLNIVEAYESACREGRGMSWCQQMGFAYDLFVDVEASREYLLKVLDGLNFPLADERSVRAFAEEKRQRVRRALCAAFYDQLARPRIANTAAKGFVRVLDEVTKQQVQQNAHVFASKTQAATDPSDDEGTDTEHDQSQAGEVVEPVVRLGSSSTMWMPEVSGTLGAEELVVCGSLILTDSSTQCDPTVTLLTHVTPGDVKAAASGWCQLVDFDELMVSSARKKIVLALPTSLAKSFVANGASWLTKLQRTFGPSFVATIRDNKLCATCPPHRQARVEHLLRKRVEALSPESYVIQLPDHVNMGQLIGKRGQNMAALRATIEKLLSSEDCGAGHEHVQSHPLSVDSDKKTVTVTLQGPSKPMMSVVVGRVQSAITGILGAQALPLALDASGERSQQVEKCPRLAQLLNPTPPTAWTTRDDVVLQLAHALVWKANASIHGGFVRDWVVRGEAANDIDVQVAPPSTTEESIEEWLTGFLAASSGAAAKSLTISNKRMKGAAVTLTVSGKKLGTPIDIDLIDRNNLKAVAPPGVDSDAGNLLLNRSQSPLRKKVLSAGGSLSSALDNVQQKRFVFYYPLESGSHQAMSVRRLKTYLGRGWACLSPVPKAVQELLTESERALICPAADAT